MWTSTAPLWCNPVHEHQTQSWLHGLDYHIHYKVYDKKQKKTCRLFISDCNWCMNLWRVQDEAWMPWLRLVINLLEAVQRNAVWLSCAHCSTGSLLLSLHTLTSKNLKKSYLCEKNCGPFSFFTQYDLQLHVLYDRLSLIDSTLQFIYLRLSDNNLTM